MLLVDDDDLEIDDIKESESNNTRSYSQGSPIRSKMTNKSQTVRIIEQGIKIEGESIVDPMKEHKQSTITTTIEPKEISRKMNR